MNQKVLELAKMIDHTLLHPTATDADLERECALAIKYNVASMCVKPYWVKKTSDLLHGTDVKVGCVIGFPAGNSKIEVKVFEAEMACRDGAVEIDMVINIARALEGDWNYVEKEIAEVTNVCHKHGAIVKVIFEVDYITNEQDVIKLCEICTKVEADYVKTSTGFGFVKQANGDFNYKGATVDIISLMRKHSGPKVKVKAAGGVRTLDQLLAVKEAGATRSGATATAAIMEDAMKRFV